MLDVRRELSDAPFVNAPATESALRRHLRSHNRSVLAASIMTLLFSAIGWAILYGAAYWIAMFGLTVVNNGEGGPPAAFHWVFLACAAVLLVAATIDGWLFPHERAVDERPPFEHVMDIILFVPRFTLLFWSNLSALVSLQREEWRDAADLLDRLKAEGKVPLQQLPAQIPDERSLARILETLSVTQLIDVRRAGNLTLLYLSSLAPEEFHRRARAGESPRDELTGMKQASLRERRKLLTDPTRDAGDDGEPGR